MKQCVLVWVVVCGVCAGAAKDANAQVTGTWADRGYVNIGFGVESGSSAVTDTQNVVIYEESGTVTSESSFTSGNILDAGFGFRVWRNLTVGVAYHQEENSTDGHLTGSIPSPIFFNRPREFSQTVTSLVRKEKATHLVIGWVLPISPKFDVMVFAGPSFFRVDQDAVSEVEFGERGSPFTEVVAQPERATRKKSATGFNAGFDATYILWSNDDVRLGAGGFLRFTKATADVLMLGSEQETQAGGVQFGIGARIRF
jgi:hypothetical protein